MQKVCALVFSVTLLFSGAVFGQISISEFNVPIAQDFNTLATSGNTNSISTLPSGWLFVETGTNANFTYGAGPGSLATGNTYSFGAAGISERAFGGLQSGTLVPTIGVALVNNTGAPITRLLISYRGEQWRLGAIGRMDKLDFQYALDPGSLQTGTWSDVDELDFIAPTTTGTIGPLVGNDAPNNQEISFEITGLNIPPDMEVYFRWVDFNASGADDGLAVDDITITAVQPLPDPVLTLTPLTVNFGDVNTGEHSTISYQVTGENLHGPIIISVENPVFSISTDGVSFSSTGVLPTTGGTVQLRFSPTVNGLQESDIVHNVESDALTSTLVASGFGFVQAENIIPISVARSRPVGSKVTVAGRITVANELGNPAYVQDGTGGIPVFHADLANNVAIGDSVIVTGPIGVFNNQIQISGSGIFYTLASTVKRILTPKNITIAELNANEGLLVTVQGIELVNKSFVFFPQSTEQITDGTTQANLRIDGDTNIPGLAKPQGVVDITGVVGRFQANAQLLPRFQPDIPDAVEPTAPTDNIPKSQTFDVVTWNFEFFGAEREDYNEEFGPADEALQLQNIKQVLDLLQADIVAVQEVSDVAFFGSLVSQLGTYGYTCSDRYSHSFEGPSSTFPPQQVCFIYNTTTVDVLSTRVIFEDLYDEARTTTPALLPGYPGGDPSSFYSSGRLPYMLMANVTINGVTEPVSLVAVHAKSGASAADRSRREYDANVLKDSLDVHYPNASVIFLGDLNDDLDASITVGMTSPYAAFVSDVADYDPVTKALSDAGARSTMSFGDVIDHQVITNELQDEYLEGSAQVIAAFRYVTNYANTTSDHLPVITRFQFTAPVVSFLQSQASVAEQAATHTVSLSFSKPFSVNKQLSINIGGNATYTNDYLTDPASASGQVILNVAAGQSTASFTITMVDDTADETDETASFTLVPSTGIEVGNPSTFSLTIQDNDIPTISFKELQASAAEGSGPYAVALKLSGPVATNQTVKIFATTKHGHKDYGTDYVTEPAAINNIITVEIAAGSSEAYFNIIPLTDKKREKHGEVVGLYLKETTAGLIGTHPRLSFFTIVDTRKKPEFNIYPNPTWGSIELLCDELDDDEVIRAELRHQNGELLYSGSGSLGRLSDALTNRLKNARKGVYLVYLTIDNETYQLRVSKQ